MNSRRFIRSLRRRATANCRRFNAASWGVEIDDEVELGWLLDPQVGRLCTFEYFHVAAGVPLQFNWIGHHVQVPRLGALISYSCFGHSDFAE